MRRRWYEVPPPGDLSERPVSLVKDSATKFFGGWSTDWADSGWVRNGPDGEGPAAPPGPTLDDTPGEQAVAFGDAVAVPVEGSFLVTDGVIRPVDGRWMEMGPTRDGRTRWTVHTKYEGDAHE